MNKPISTMPRILIVCDESDTGPFWSSNLARKQIQTNVVRSHANPLQAWAETTPDLILFDILEAKPKILDLIRDFRQVAMNPLLVFLKRGNETEILSLYEAGADDCQVKPLSMELFLAKIRAWLRRSWTISSSFLEPVRAGKYSLLPGDHCLMIEGGSAINLTNLELRLMHYLMSRPNRAAGTEELIQRVWGYQDKGDVTALKNIVYRLRHKIEGDPKKPCLLCTVPGGGYQFIAK